ENQLSLAFEALKAITGVEYTNVSQLSPEFPVTPPESALDEWTSLTEENNLQLRSAELDLEAKREDARAARAAMWPTLNVGVNWRRNWPAGLNFFTTANEQSNIALNFSMPLFS